MSSTAKTISSRSTRQQRAIVVSNTFDHVQWEWYDEVLNANYSLPDGQLKHIDATELELFTHPEVFPAVRFCVLVIFHTTTFCEMK
jgi:hypothetical protein